MVRAERMFLPGIEVPALKHADEAGARFGVPHNHCNRRAAVAGVDHETRRRVRIGMLLGEITRAMVNGASALACPRCARPQARSW